MNVRCWFRTTTEPIAYGNLQSGDVFMIRMDESIHTYRYYYCPNPDSIHFFFTLWKWTVDGLAWKAWAGLSSSKITRLGKACLLAGSISSFCGVVLRSSRRSWSWRSWRLWGCGWVNRNAGSLRRYLTMCCVGPNVLGYLRSFCQHWINILLFWAANVLGTDWSKVWGKWTEFVHFFVLSDKLSELVT